MLREGVELDVRGTRSRTLLARLLIGRNAPVTVDQLIEALWPDTDSVARRPREPTKAVHVIVSRVRSAIEPPAVVETREGAYLLRVADGACDADRFAELTRDGRHALDAGDFARGAALLEQGLGLWRGEALSEYAYQDWTQAEIGRLEELRVLAEEARAEAELALGRHAGLVPRLEALAVQHPLRESVQALLMLALHRCGRQKEALDAYARLRGALIEQGLEPGPERRRLQQQILEHDPALDLPEAAGPAAAPPAGPVPLPDQVGFAARGALAGRSAELEQIAALVRDLGGRRQVVALAGEAGVGKTRLLAAAAMQAHADGWPVLHGRAYEGSPVPYQPFVEALRHHLEHRPRLDLAADAALAPAAAPLAELLPEIEPLLPDERPPSWADPEAGRYRLHVAFATVLSRVAASERLLLVLDDLQWADDPTLRLVRELVGRSGTADLVVLAAFREGEVTEQLGALLDDLLRDRRVTVLPLGGLAPPDVAELAAGLGVSASSAVVRAVWRATRGNPFLIEHLLPELVGVGDEQVAGALAAIDMPQPIRSLLTRRLRALPAHVAETLGVAAVLGREFRLGTLEAIAPSGPSVADAVERALDARLLRPGSGPDDLEFAHDALQRTLADALPAFRAARLHLAAATALEASGADPAELLHHYEAAAEIGGAAKAAEHGLALAARLAGAHQHAAAAERYAAVLRAMDAMAPPPRLAERCAALLGLAGSLERVDIEAARDAYRRAAAVAATGGETTALGLAAVGFAGWTQYGTVDHEAISMLETALAALPPEDSGVRAQVSCLLAVRLDAAEEQARREALWQEGRAMAERAGPEGAVAGVLRFAPYVLWRPESLGERREAADEAVRRADGAGLADASLWGHVNGFVERLEAADVAGADAALAAAGRLAGDVGHAWFDWYLPMLRSSRLLLAGDVDGARELAEASLRVRERQEPGAREAYAAQLAALARAGGAKREAAVTELEAQVERFPRRVVWRVLLADLRLASGEADAARGAMAPLLEGPAALPSDVDRLAVLALGAELAARLGAGEIAERLGRELAPFAGRLILIDRGWAVWGPVSRVLGVVAALTGDAEAAGRHFTAALGELERVGARSWLARTRAEEAQLLRSPSAHSGGG